MFTRLEQNCFAVLVMMALCVALILALPTPARAQAAPTKAEDTPNVHANTHGKLSHAIVRPGDSLWTISKKQLGPDATLQRIANGVEQIYALNRKRLGADPALILVGQELLVPRTMSSERPTGASPAPRSAEVGPEDRVVEGNTAREPQPAPKTVTGGAAQAAEDAEALETPVHRSDGPVRLPALPEEASIAPVPAVTAVASNEVRPTAVVPFLRMIRAEFASAASTLVEVFSQGAFDTRVEGHRLLGLGILALTFVVAVLIALKLPMRRATLKDAVRWGIAASYYGEMPTVDRTTPFAYHPGSPGGSLVMSSDENSAGLDTRSRAPAAVGGVRRISFMARSGRNGSTISERRPAPKAKPAPRNSLALGAHNPEVRRVPLRIHSTLRARKLRPRRRPMRQPKVVSTRDGH